MRKPPHNLSRWGIALAVFLAIAALDVLGLLDPIDRALMDARFQLLEREASGDIVIVQIDPRSLREIDVWPWPRRYHAQLIDRLLAAGAREIVLDIDLSARGGAENDKALAAALERAQGQVIIPAFRQAVALEADDVRVYDTLPRPEFMAHAQVGSINVSPAPDGRIRAIADVQRVGSERVPAVFALLAGPSAIRGRSFHIDFGIDPNSVPRVSYVDVLRGEVAPGALAGKAVIVGATAAELGDSLPVPVYRSMAGPALQALAYESVHQGRDIKVFGSALSVPLSAVLVVLFTAAVGRLRFRTVLLSCVVAVVAIEAAALALQAVAPVALTTGPWIAVAGMSALVAAFRAMQSQARQILEQRAAIATRRALMDRMVENSFDGIIIADQSGTVRLMNEAAGTILHRPLSEAMEGPLEEILPGARDLMAAVALVQNGDQAVSHSAPHETITRRPNGDEVPIELTIGVVDLGSARPRDTDQFGAKTYYTYTFRDISERKAAQEAQRRAAEAALAANRAKTEFLANMSHELRTPLNAIIGFSEMIRNKVLGPIEPSSYGEYVDDIHESGTHLLGIINDILDVSRIELGRYELMDEELDPADLLESCARITAGWSAYGRRRFTTQVSRPLPRIIADGRVIKQVIINLLSNAFKYSEDGDSIELAAGLDDMGELVITVTDNGIGIAPEHLPNLTSAFYQVDGGFIRESGGVGLGLSLCAGQVKLHGGELSIDSELGEGTVVTIRFPAERIVTPSLEAGAPA